MRSAIVLSGALAALVSAHDYPNCEHNNCYRNIIDERFVASATPLCQAFLASTVTAPAAIPTIWENCAGVSAVSSACSCITYVPSSTTSASETTSVSVTTVSSPPPTSTATLSTSTEDCDDETTTMPTSTSQRMTTKTTSVTKTYTVTSCAPTVTDCPSRPHVTTTVVVETTVCPADEDETKPPHNPTKPPHSSTKATTTTKPTGTGYTPTKPTGSVPTAAAGRVNAGLGAAAVAAFGALLL